MLGGKKGKTHTNADLGSTKKGLLPLKRHIEKKKKKKKIPLPRWKRKEGRMPAGRQREGRSGQKIEMMGGAQRGRGKEGGRNS